MMTFLMYAAAYLVIHAITSYGMFMYWRYYKNFQHFTDDMEVAIALGPIAILLISLVNIVAIPHNKLRDILVTMRNRKS